MPNSGSYAGRSHAEYKRALAHSRLVRLLKVLLPLSAAVVILGFILVSWVDGLVPEGVGIESVVIRDGKLVMQNPVMSGEGPGARPYTMRAARAVQDLTSPDVIVLETIRADLPVSAGDTAVLEAASAIFDRSAQTLVFKQPFKVESEGGFSVEMQSANIDIDNQ
jgi:lipopolysaccharide export system protein LptC